MQRTYTLVRTFVVLLCLAAATPCLAADSFKIVFLPDTQHYSDSASNITHFNNQTQWIVDNQAAENIVFVSHLGDLVQTSGDTTQWARADAAMDILDNGAPNLPYGVVAGNHDGAPTSMSNYVTNFGSARYTGKSWYGGSDTNQHNSYQVFSAGGRDFLHLSLEMKACSTDNTDRADVITWAQGVIDAHPNSPTIISTHSYLSPTSVRSSEGHDIFNALVTNNRQVFMALGGHFHNESHRTVQNSSGDDVFEILTNYQVRTEGGTGWLRIIEFDEDAGMINNVTYSPSLNQYETDANSQFSFSFDTIDTRFDPVTPPTPPQSGLIGHWKFDEGIGNTTDDSSSNSNIATQAGEVGTWISGKVGSGAYEINSTHPAPGGDGTSRFEVGDSSDLRNTGAITVAAWVNPTAASHYGLIAGVDQTGGTPNDMYALKTSASSTDKLRWAVVGSDGLEIAVESTDKLFETLGDVGDGWIHVVGVFDPDNDKVLLYINGTLDIFDTITAPELQYRTTDFQIGHNASDGSANSLNAALDDIQIYNLALSAEQIAFLYNNPGSIVSVPEPATMTLLALGGLGILARRRR